MDLLACGSQRVLEQAWALLVMLPTNATLRGQLVECGDGGGKADWPALLPSGERRLFTHAQVVENCTLVQVRRAVDAQKYVARVRTRACSAPCPSHTRPLAAGATPPHAHAHSAHLATISQVVCIGFDVDLAVMTVDDPSFWDGIPALQLPTELPGIMTEVMAVGFADGRVGKRARKSGAKRASLSQSGW